MYSDSIILTSISDYLFYISSQCCSCVFCIHVASVFEETTTIIYSDFIYGLLQFFQHFVFLGRVVWRQLTVFYSIFYLSSSSILHRRYFLSMLVSGFLKKKHYSISMYSAASMDNLLQSLAALTQLAFSIEVFNTLGLSVSWLPRSAMHLLSFYFLEHGGP